MPSTVIQKIEYDPGTGSLTIYFVSGLAYVYHNVPEGIYRQFRAFREKGVYFNQQIKNKYSYRKLAE